MTRDQEIIGRIRQGDKSEFESLFRSSYASLVHYAKKILKDQDTAEEIVQDLFFRLWQNKNNLNIESSLNGYLFRAVHNKCLHHISHARIVERYAAESVTSSENQAENPADIIQFGELQKKIATILERLPERCSLIFCMNRFEGLKYNEIAEKLSVSVKTVEANMGKALKEFRKELRVR
jgi:RNA polymerase sigma-70 factor, ECF subfamily